MKYLLTLLMIALTFYAPYELSGLILGYGFAYYPDMRSQFIGELVFIWASYLGAIYLVFRLANKRYNKGEFDKETDKKL